MWEQARAAIFVIGWSAVGTFVILHVIKFVLRGLRYKDEVLEVGDLAIHDEEAFPEEKFAERVGGGSAGAFALAGIGGRSPDNGTEVPSGAPPEPQH